MKVLNFTMYVSTNIAYIIGLCTHLIIVYFHEIVFTSSYIDHIPIFIKYLLIFGTNFPDFTSTKICMYLKYFLGALLTYISHLVLNTSGHFI